jgi:hypothetical protein
MDEKIVTDNGVTIIGYTDFPSRMAAQSSSLYATNIRHMMTDLTPEKDGKINHNMEDDVIRGATVAFDGEITFPPPPPKVQAIAAKPKEKVKELTPEEKRRRDCRLQGADQATGHAARHRRRADAVASALSRRQASCSTSSSSCCRCSSASR